MEGLTDEHDCYANRLQLVSQGHTFICSGHYQLEMISDQMDLLGYDIKTNSLETRYTSVQAKVVHASVIICL